MIQPSNRQGETAVFPPGNKRMAFTISVILAVVMTILTAVSQLLLKSHGQTLSIGPLRLVAVAATLLNLLFIWRERVMLGTSILAVTFFSIIGFIISQIEGMGLFLSFNATTILVVLFSYSWPKRWLRVGVTAVIAAGIALLLADLYWSVPRPPFPSFLFPVHYTAIGIVITLVIVLIGRQFRDYSVQVKLIATFAFIATIPVLLLSVGNYLGLREALIDEANQKLQNAAAQTAVSLDDFFETNITTIRSEASILGAAYDFAYYASLTEDERTGPVDILAEEKALSLLKTFRDKDPINITSYALLDMNGQVLFEYPIPENKGDESDRSYYTELIESGRYYVSPVEFSPVTGEAFFHFSTIVIDNVGRQAGVLRARYRADVLQLLITRSTGSIGGQSFAVLFDENQLQLAHGTASESLYKLVSLPSPEELQALQVGNRLPDIPTAELSTNSLDLSENLKLANTTPIFAATDITTGDRINQVAVSGLDNQPWQVAFFQPQEVFLAPIQTLIRRTVILALFVLGSAAVAAYIVSGYIARPILQLENIASHVAEGDLTIQAPVLWNDEVGALARTFNIMTAQLRDLIANLENRVAERTRALEISSQVSYELSTILDRQELVKTVVEQVKQAFDYYHVHIYLFDETGQNLIMVGGTGEAGRIMLANNHQIEAGKGLVGRAGQAKLAVLVPDTSQDAGWLPNPLLPDTKAETAVPIMSGEQVLGVLDVQHNQTGGLDQVDVNLLQSIANQVAVALRNANLYDEAQKQAEREMLRNQINQQILQTNDMQTALKIAIRELGRATGAPHVRVQLKTQNGHNS